MLLLLMVVMVIMVVVAVAAAVAVLVAGRRNHWREHLDGKGWRVLLWTCSVTWTLHQLPMHLWHLVIIEVIKSAVSRNMR